MTAGSRPFPPSPTVLLRMGVGDLAPVQGMADGAGPLPSLKTLGSVVVNQVTITFPQLCFERKMAIKGLEHSMSPVHPSNLLLCSACVRLRDGGRIALEFKEQDSCGSLFVIPCPHQSLVIYALLLTAYLFAICSTDLQYRIF